MNFSDKLQLIRRNKGMTQEELAEKLSVSRQAVAKWESGQSYPDITNLITVSDVFNVSVDYLVKDNDCEVSLVNSLTASEALISFLVTAKKHTYANKEGQCVSSRLNSHDYRYQEGEYLYLDTFLGSEIFSGEEAVWYQEQPIYSMNYCGRVLDEGFSSNFLKEALLEIPTEMPFRGPKWYQQGDYLYQCKTSGTIEWFQGYEEIQYRDIKVYECYYHGGLLK